jgi:hypothetical protein
MGLDMYLSAKKHYSDGEWRPEDNRKDFQKIIELSGIQQFTSEAALPSAYLEVSIGYWRKANAVHQWFVDNCQGGVDDCRTAYVDTEKLQELKKICEAVLLQPAIADDELPTSQGFFFGSYEYDEFYFDDLKQTV